MASKAELVNIRHPQIVPARSAMRIVTIRAADFALPHRVVVRHAHLRRLGLMALQAGIVRRRWWPHEHVSFWGYGGGRQRCSSRGIEAEAVFIRGSESLSMDLMAVDAAHSVSAVLPGHPVPELFALYVTA